MTLSDLAKYSVIRSIARPLCDSRATCKFCSVVGGVTLMLNPPSSVSREQQMTPLISDECHQLATFRCSCVYNTWRSHCWQHAMKPDIGQESRFFSYAFDTGGGAFCRNIDVTFGVAKIRCWLSDGEKTFNLKICSRVSTEYTNVTDRRTPHDGMAALIA